MIAQVDNWLIDRLFKPIAVFFRDRLNIDHWLLSRELYSAGIMGACAQLIVAIITGVSSTWWIFLLPVFVLAGKIEYNHVTRMSKIPLGWLIARQDQFFIRWFFIGFIANSLIGLVMNPGWNTLASLTVISLGTASLFLRCVDMPPPPPPKEDRRLVPAYNR